MERGNSGCTRGRLKVAAALVVFIMVLALPAMALAGTGSWSNRFPTGTITKSPNMVGAIWSGAGIRATAASILIDGTSVHPVVSTTVIPGWHQTFVLNNGVYQVIWTTGDPAGGLPQATIYSALPSSMVLANGPHTFTIGILDTSVPAVQHSTTVTFTVGPLI